MSIKALALDLYRAQQQVDKLKKSIDKESYEHQDSLKWELKVAEREHQMLRKMLDGQKESGSFIKNFEKFSSFK